VYKFPTHDFTAVLELFQSEKLIAVIIDVLVCRHPL